MSDNEAAAPPPAAAVEAAATIGSAAAATGSNSSADMAGPLADVPGPIGGEQLGDAIIRLKLEQDAIRISRKKIAKELQNATKRKQRLKKRAKQLSDTDLLAVLQLRASEKPSSGSTAAT
jgi:hypothetical protein